MENTLEFFRSGGVDVSAAGRRRWPDDLKARIVAETLEPGVTVRDVAERYGVGANRISEWRRLAKDSKLTLPAAVEAAEFAPLLLCDEQLPLSSSKTTPAADIPLIEIAIGKIMIRLDGSTPAARIAEIVRAMGSPT